MKHEKRASAAARVSIVTALCLLAVASFGQDSAMLLTLNQAVSTALQQNKNILIAHLDEKGAETSYKQTDAVFLPRVNMSYSVISTNDPLNVFGFKLQQQTVKQQDFDPVLLNHPAAMTDFMAQAGIQQPVLNLEMLYMHRSALKQIEIQRYKTLRTQNYITWQVKQAYLQLGLSYDAMQVLQDALTTAKATYKFINDRYLQGLLQKSDLLNASVQIKTVELNIAEAGSNIKNTSDALSLLMNKPEGTIYSTEPENELFTLANYDSLPAGRADIKAMETGLAAYDLLMKGTKMQYLPRIDAFANYQWNDKSLLAFGGSGYLAGIQLSWNIFDGFQTKNKIAAQQIERSKLAVQLEEQKDEGKLEINKAKRTLSDALFKISQQQQAVDESAEALRILQNRYSQGLVNTTDVLAAQTQLAQQKLALAQAFYVKRTTQVYLQFLTATNQ